jgi:hypothetical protein
MLRYRLWDIDPIINRVLVYGLLTAGLMLAYYGGVQLVLAFTSVVHGGGAQPAAGALIVFYSIVVAMLLLPLRRRIQTFIDHRFYRRQVDFQQAFTAFAQEIRAIIELSRLLQVLVERLTSLLYSGHGAIFLRRADTNSYTLAAQIGNKLEPGALLALPLPRHSELSAGRPSLQTKDEQFPLLLPLTAPQKETGNLLGVLALGPRRSGQPYSRSDLALLSTLATQAGTAIAVAQLVEAERALEAHRRSPVGRAEQLASALLAQPQGAFITLHELARQAATHPEPLSLLASLGSVLDSQPEPNARLIARLSDGFHDIVMSQYEPEQLTAGLRTLVFVLEELLPQHWLEVEDALDAYHLCQTLLRLETAEQVVQTLVAPRPEAAPTNAGRFDELRRACIQLRPVVNTLTAYSKDVAPDNQLLYLGEAIERLEAWRQAILPGLVGPERLLAQRMGEHLLALVAEELSVLRISAQLRTKLKTSRVLHGERVALVLVLTNLGRGAATDLQVALLPDAGYEGLGGAKWIGRLSPEQQVELDFTVRPLARDTLQPRFRIGYNDQRRTGRTQIVETTVQLLHIPVVFHPIPNPYVAGPPLRGNSPIFVGREDMITFIQEALDSEDGGHAFVLIGQRRMGKTSLLQQLPWRLGEQYIVVYLDGQALAIEPGMASFFHDWACQTAGAVGLPRPEGTRFQTSPSTVFTQAFLPQAIAAAQDKRLLFLFDEFEELEQRVTGNQLEPEIFPYLRHLVQHGERLAFIFAGTHKLEELNPVYWSSFFNIALHRRLGVLDEVNARRLITMPVASHLLYDDLALEKMARATSGHPYFLQLLCQTIVFTANQEQRNWVAISHVNSALDQVLELGEAHFVFLWEHQTTPEEKQVLRAAAALLTGGMAPTKETLIRDPALASDVTRCSDLPAILAKLVQQELLVLDKANESYKFALDLLRLWINRREG